MGSSSSDYPSDPVDFVIPNPPGGGNDAFGRPLTDPLSRELGVDVNFVNRPPASQTIPQLYEQSTDGYEFTIFQPTAFTSLTLQEGFDSAWNGNDWSQLGALDSAQLALILSYASDAEDFGDAVELSQSENVTFNAAVIGGGQKVEFDIIQETGIQVERISGWDGAGEILAEMQRGNIDFYFGPITTAAIFIQEEVARPVLVKDPETLHEGTRAQLEELGITDLPGYEDVGLETLVPLGTTVRACVLPPGVSDDRVGVLRDGVWNAISSDEYQAATEEQGNFYNPQSPEEAEEHVGQVYETLRDYAESTD